MRERLEGASLPTPGLFYTGLSREIHLLRQIYWACGELRAVLEDTGLSEVYVSPVKTVIRRPCVFSVWIGEVFRHRETGSQRVGEVLSEERPTNFWHEHGARGPRRP